MQRLGVLGGSFDPPHIGHLALAEAVREELELDRVVFVPARQQPLKAGHGASAADRLALVAAAVQANPAFVVDDLELRRAGPSFTLATLATLRTQHPTAGLWFLLGADALAGLPRWHAPEQLVQLARLAVVARPGVALDLTATTMALPALAGQIDVVAAPLLDLSATLLRERVAAGRSIRYLVPEAVRLLIKQRGLYAARSAD